VHWVLKVITHRNILRKYETYCAGVEAHGDFVSAGKSLSNEQRRWHGTLRECLLGDEGRTETCNSTKCRLCQIIRRSFKIELFGNNKTWGRFGKGICTTATSSKANDYSNKPQKSKFKILLLNKVLGEVAPGGTFNYDELVLYSNDAIRPSYPVVYDA